MKRKHLITIGCDYCHCFIIVLAFYSRRLECLAQCKLIFQYYHARLFG